MYFHLEQDLCTGICTLASQLQVTLKAAGQGQTGPTQHPNCNAQFPNLLTPCLPQGWPQR